MVSRLPLKTRLFIIVCGLSKVKGILAADLPYAGKELLVRLSKGDEAAMEMIFRQYYHRLCYFAQRLTRDESEAQDITQEALTSLWTHFRDKKEMVDNLEAWLFTIVRNKCYNFIRRQRMKEERTPEIRENISLSEEGVENELIREDIFNKVYQEFAALPARQAEIMKLIYMEGMDTDEIARRLRITPNNIRNQKARALVKIRSLILKKGFLSLLINFF